MRKLVSGVLLLASQAGGCVIVEDDYGSYEEPALITARWQFTDLAAEKTTACPAGFDTVALHSQPVDFDGRPRGPAFVDLFDCADGVGVTDPLDPDVYQSWIEVTSFDRTRLYAESTSSIVDVIVRDATFEAEILNDGGYFALSWDLIGATSNRRLACSEAGASRIETISTSMSTSRATETDQFICEDGFGVTGGFVAGDYTLQLTAAAGVETSLHEPITLDNKTIRDRNRITDLGTVTIPIANR